MTEDLVYKSFFSPIPWYMWPVLLFFCKPVYTKDKIGGRTYLTEIRCFRGKFYIVNAGYVA